MPYFASIIMYYNVKIACYQDVVAERFPSTDIVSDPLTKPLAQEVC